MMKRIIYILFIGLIYSSLWSEGNVRYIDKPFTLNSIKVLGQGNTFVAEAHGLEAFEFNPAGLVEEDSFTLVNINMNLIADIFQLNDDLLAAFNDMKGLDKSVLSPGDLIFLLGSENVQSIVDALLSQTNIPPEGSNYANGFGLSPVFSTGFVKNGFGLGFAMNLDSVAYGSDILTTKFTNVLTSTLMVGYGLNLDLGIISLDVGAGFRPMYKIRATSGLDPFLSLIPGAESTNDDSGLKELNYSTGMGFGWDIGAKVHFMDLTAGLALIDMFGTTIAFSDNTYEGISDGKFIGDQTNSTDYFTPMSIKLGVSYNPNMGILNSIIDPVLAIDYRVLIANESTVEDYVDQGVLWNNLSVGFNTEFFSFIDLRAGLNQGYVSLGAGIDLWIIELNASVYSKELGTHVGDRQQMGAGLDFIIRF